MGKGQLLFKGEKAKKAKKRIKTKHHGGQDGASYLADGTDTEVAESGQRTGGGVSVDDGGPVTRDTKLAAAKSEHQISILPPSSTSAAGAAAAAAAAATPTVRNGSGKITTSATVVTGFGTKFEKEINVGDAILCQEEMRIVTMRLSNVSLNLSSPFSTDLKEPHSFQYIRKPRDAALERKNTQQKSIDLKRDMEKNVYDLYNNQSLVYREKTETGSYRIKRDGIDGSKQVTRGDLLQLRAKRTSDKYC